jgi:hypothetical protein
VHGWLERRYQRGCMRASAGAVHVAMTADGVPHVSGVTRCGSGWACPVCAPVVRQRRSERLEVALHNALEDGLEVWFATLTLPHDRGDPLAELLDALGDSWRSLLAGRAGQSFRSTWGVLGHFRAVDVTWSARAGWHPHYHVGFVVDRRAHERGALFGAALVERWITELARVTGRKASPAAQRCDQARDVRSVAEYAMKVDGGWSLSSELARTDLKVSEAGATPWALAIAASDGEEHGVALHAEYLAATHGRSWLRWSPGLRARLRAEDDGTDEEDATGDESGEIVVELLLTPAQWWGLVRAGKVGALFAQLWSTRARVHDPPSPG